MSHWLVKTEPGTFSVQDWSELPNCETSWEGVRNYQARNYMRDDMRVGDGVLVYHSVKEPIGIVGLAEVCSQAYLDHFQFDPNSEYFDPKATQEKPIWMMVNMRLLKILKSAITLKELRGMAELDGMELLRKGSRLSVQPVSIKHWSYLCRIIQERGL